MHDQIETGREALRYLNTSESPPADVARTCTETILKHQGAKSQDYRDTQDGVLFKLLQQSTAAKAVLAERLRQNNTSISFQDIYIIGDGAAEGITTVVLSPEAWPTEETRTECEKNVFLLFIAKLLEVGDDDGSRAMRGISRLMTADASTLHNLIDEDTFDTILSSLDYRNPIETKSPATLATAKLLEAAENRGQMMLTKFVTTHYALQTAKDLILAFSAAAAVFPIATSIAASLFLIKDFLPSLVPLLEKKARSQNVRMAALEMLSAACVDGACRESIKKYCLEWIQHIINMKEDEASVVASVILAKIQGTPGQSSNTNDNTEEVSQTDFLVHRLTQLLFENPKTNRSSVFEGLAHQSVRPNVKERLINDKAWLQIFLQELYQAANDAPTAFGGLIIVENLTAYLPVLSDEQKRIAQLKAYANATPSSSQPDVLNEEQAVSRRCEVLTEIGAISTIVGMSKNLSPSCLALVFKIFLSITRTPKLRGTVAQQGGVKMLASAWDRLRGTPTQERETRQNAGQAIARILISTDPSVLFGHSGNALLQSVIPPLISLLEDDAALALDGPRDLLPTFEGLLALTNLTSIPTNGATKIVVKTARAAVEDLVLSNNTNIRRASTELMSNLVQHPDGIILFADGSHEAAKRLHILLALAGSEDLGTRKAAGGALAALTGYGEIVDAINKQEKGMDLLLTMLEDEHEEMIHRAVVCVIDVLGNQDTPGGIARQRMQQLNIEQKLKRSLLTAQSKNIKDLVRQALTLVK